MAGCWQFNSIIYKSTWFFYNSPNPSNYKHRFFFCFRFAYYMASQSDFSFVYSYALDCGNIRNRFYVNKWTAALLLLSLLLLTPSRDLGHIYTIHLILNSRTKLLIWHILLECKQKHFVLRVLVIVGAASSSASATFAISRRNLIQISIEICRHNV